MSTRREVARWFGVPLRFVLPIETVVPFWDKESVIPDPYNEGVQAMQVTDAMVQAFGEAWAAQNAKPGNEVGARRRAGLEAVFRLLYSSPGVVLMTREVFEDIEAQLRKLRRLEAAGVDNWSGYDTAMEPIWAAEDEESAEDREAREAREAREDEAQMFKPRLRPKR